MRPTPLSRIRRAFAAPAVLLALAACSEPAAPPEPLATTYVLTRLGNSTTPLVLGEHTLPSGTYQVYVMAYDTLQFDSPTAGRRSFMLSVSTRAFDGATVPVLDTPFERITTVSRRRNRVVLEYDPRYGRLKPDTFELRDGNLVKQGPYGVVCTGCEPLKRVEYVYEPR